MNRALTCKLFLSLSVLLVACGGGFGQDLRIIAGPITNVVNGHIYYLVDQSNWTMAEAAAERLGGHLATIRNQSEQNWVYSTFSTYGGVRRNLWIGLYDPDPNENSRDVEVRKGEFVWVSGEQASYSNWARFEPNNDGNNGEFWVHMWYPSRGAESQWNDLTDRSLFKYPINGVVEVISIPKKREPMIILQPQNQAVPCGDAAVLRVEAIGSNPLSYQWEWNGINLSGANQPNLRLENVNSNHQGAYRVLVSNSEGTITSREVTLTILPGGPLPIITMQPLDQTVVAGTTVLFTVGATGVGPLSYQWQYNGSSIVGETNQALRLINVQSGNQGIYSVLTSNCGGSTRSQTVTLTINIPNSKPTISSLADQTTNEDTAAGPIPFILGDKETSPALLGVMGNSSNPNLVPDANIVFGGTGQNRSITITPAPDQFGITTITLTITDADGGIVSESFLLTVNSVNDPPSFTKGSDQVVNGSSGLQTIESWAKDASAGPLNETGQMLSFQVSNDHRGLFSMQPSINSKGTLTFAPTSNASGVATVTVVLKDSGGTANGGIEASAAQTFTITFARLNESPTVVITNPVDNTQFSARSTISVVTEAGDRDGTIAKVEFFEGATKLGEATTTPFSFAWSDVKEGSYSLTAKATDNLGATAMSAPVRITVSPPANLSPAVAITSPSNRATYPPDVDIAIEGAAFDPDGVVTKVEFYAGSTSLGTVTSPPYKLVWPGVAVGDYVLTAKAVDDKGAISISTPVKIAVTGISGDVAIVRSFSNPEIDSLRDYLFEMGLSSRVFDQEGLTLEALQTFKLVIWDDFGDVSHGLTDSDVAIFQQVFNAGIPLYFIGENLASSAANLSESRRKDWTALVHLAPTDRKGGDGTVRIPDVIDLHPIFQGRFGKVESFEMTNLVDLTIASDADVGVLASSAGADLLVSLPSLDMPSAGQTRTMSQNFSVLSGGNDHSLAQRKILFQNTVCWLIGCAPCGTFGLMIEASGSEDTVQVGDRLTYHLTVYHSGECESTGVTVTNRLASGFEFVTADSGKGIWRRVDDLVIFNIGRVSIASETTMTVVALAKRSGTFTNVAEVSANGSVFNDTKRSSVVSVVAPSVQPSLSIQQMDPHNFQIQVDGQIGQSCLIERSNDDLLSWRIWTNVTIVTPPLRLLDSTSASLKQRYYRARVP